MSDWFPVTEFIRQTYEGDRTLFKHPLIQSMFDSNFDRAQYLEQVRLLLSSNYIIRSPNGFALMNGTTTKATYDYKLKYTLLNRVMQTYGGSYSERDYNVCVKYWDDARLLANNLVEVLQSDRAAQSLDYAITRHKEVLQRKLQGLQQLVDSGLPDDPAEIGMPHGRPTYIKQDLVYIQQQLVEYSENAKADRELLKDCSTKISHLSAVLLDSQYQKSVACGHVIISCKTGECTIPVTSARRLGPPALYQVICFQNQSLSGAGGPSRRAMPGRRAMFTITYMHQLYLLSLLYLEVVCLAGLSQTLGVEAISLHHTWATWLCFEREPLLQVSE